MIQITAHMRILVAVEPVDFRKGIDGLAAVCRQQLQADPFSGTLFVFTSKSRQALRVLVYDGQGFWLCHKRLSKGRFAWNFLSGSTSVRALAAWQLQQLLWNSDPLKIAANEIFRPIPKKILFPQKSAGHRQNCLI
ncbi:MAG: IS66 family insertion sequence element accessory protein TnpB [Deltaproteobacteria bacterium]|nr:IS66 family insertion sequence element accessory protein TnpB [Deltaproteobacteria bacterium]MBW2677554.1 IS66 family insertion sequence element accessory protein TnpB [Deltaproteobacteria bacterium]